MSQQDHEKKAAAAAAVREVESGMRLGLGSGSTALHVVRMLGERVRRGLDIVGVPTSRETARAAREAGIELADLSSSPFLDLAIDGTDEVDGSLFLIKGGGGALLREKIVASASKRFLIVSDGSKVVETLGAFPLPIEVIPMAIPLVTEWIRALGVEPILRDFTTDEGNKILDCPFGAIEDPESLGLTLSTIPGVVEHGLFLHMASEVIIAEGDEIRHLVAEDD